MGEPVHEWLICPFEVGMQMLMPHSAPARTIKQPADALQQPILKLSFQWKNSLGPQIAGPKLFFINGLHLSYCIFKTLPISHVNRIP